MDALMAALVAAIVIHATDRTPWLIAGLGARYRHYLVILIGVAVALTAVNTLATIGGATIAPRLTPNARALFLALALAAAGLGCFGRLNAPEKLNGWRTGPLLTPLIGVLTLGFGSAQFVAMALAVRSGTPTFAATGATLGGLVVAGGALVLGEADTARLRKRAVRLPVGVILLVVATAVGLGALRLI